MYSVPSTWAYQDAKLFFGAYEVEVVRGQERIQHPRVRGGQKQIRYRHYLPELAKKPKAVRQAVHLLNNELGEPFGALWRLWVDTHGPDNASRYFAYLLAIISKHDETPVRQGIQCILDGSATTLSVLKSLMTDAPKTTAVPESLSGFTVETTPITVFSALAQGGLQ